MGKHKLSMLDVCNQYFAFHVFDVHALLTSTLYTQLTLGFNALLQEERKIPPPVPKKPPKGKFPITREKSLDLPDRQRQEARRRLMAAKRAASFRQNSATERADSIEIYIPEAQTRL